MSDFLTRLIDEKTLLDGKIQQLEPFLLSDGFNRINNAQQALLRIQLSTMKAYSQCLHERLTILQQPVRSFNLDGSNPPHGPGTPP